MRLSGVARAIRTYAAEYAARFSELTSPEISAEIDNRFGPVGAMQVKMAFGRQHLAWLVEVKGFQMAQTVIGAVARVAVRLTAFVRSQ